MQEVRYVRHIIGNGTTCTNPDKIRAIRDFLHKTAAAVLLNICVVFAVCTVLRLANCTLTDIVETVSFEVAVLAFDALKMSSSLVDALYSLHLSSWNSSVPTWINSDGL